MDPKPSELWFALAGIALWKTLRWRRSSGMTFWLWLLQVASAAALAMGLAPSVKNLPLINGDEVVAAVLVMVFGQVILETCLALASDREFVKSLIRWRTGGGTGGGI
ncbi:MAG: hypothetical protein HWE26_13635 [Alteromonadaceae bacterium]|nr:hypothetical protein [Alteromonadaceae bacterium]